VRIIGSKNRLVYGLYRRHMRTIGYLGQIDRLFGARATTRSGNPLTLNLALRFTGAFAGAKNIYMEVQNATVDSGWSVRGTWTVSHKNGTPFRTSCSVSRTTK
jgi:hypothetical protein